MPWHRPGSMEVFYFSPNRFFIVQSKALGNCLHKLRRVFQCTTMNIPRLISDGHDFSQTIIMKSISVIVETPRHTAGKYVFDPINKCYTLKKILPLGMYFPYDFGMIMNTLAEDGDPADAIIITECVTYPGVHMSCRLIGALEAKQTENGKTIRNDRYIMIAEDSLVFAHIKNIEDFSGEHNRQLMDFFLNYGKIENKELKHTKFVGAGKAEKNLEKLLK